MQATLEFPPPPLFFPFFFLFPFWDTHPIGGKTQSRALPTELRSDDPHSDM